MVNCTLKIVLAVIFVLFFGLCVGGYALINATNFKYRFYGELQDWLKIETEIDKR